MRSPAGSTGPRAGSPVSPRARGPLKSAQQSTGSVDSVEEKSPLRDLDAHVKQVVYALKHLRDVVAKDKLEMLPGNATVVLETVTMIHGVLKSHVISENSSTLVSATNQVYQSLARLMKLCDDVLLHGDHSLNKESAVEVVQLVEEAVQNLVSLSREKMTARRSLLSTSSAGAPATMAPASLGAAVGAGDPGARSSLPDIPLTPRERLILAQTSTQPNNKSHSDESIAVDSSPPPKPPLPWRLNNSPPPLPPKRRNRTVDQISSGEFDSINSNNSSGVGLAASVERISLRSKSPEDSCSLLSAASAGSLDSVLNHSREEEEIQALMDPGEEEMALSDENILAHGGTVALNGTNTYVGWDGSSVDGGADSSIALFPLLGQNQDVSSYSASSYSRSSQHRSTSSVFSTSCSGGGGGERTQTWQSSTSSCETTEQSRTLAVTSAAMGSVAYVEQRSESKASTLTAFSPALSPPALPEKMRRGRLPSQYDNVPAPLCAAHGDSQPPPLPLKKKHIMAYMEMFGNCSHQNGNEFLRHSVHTYNSMQAEWQQHEMALTTTHSCHFSASTTHHMHSASLQDHTRSDCLPPALPPKQRGRTLSARSASSPPPPPASPSRVDPPPPVSNHVAPPPTATAAVVPPAPVVPLAVEHVRNSRSDVAPPPAVTEVPTEPSPLDELRVARYLVTKKADEDGPDVRGGHPDALIVHATKANKNDFLYQEAFLTTYRTFLSPLELIEKLCRRHERFSRSSDLARQRAAREAFSLLVRVVSDLTLTDLSVVVQQTLMDFVYQLLCGGDLTMARALRVKILEKCEAKKLNAATNTLLSALNVSTRQSSLLDFKSEQIAEQMTLLDANLFMKIEIPEVLIWAQEQNEERSPNLTRFTEHFNKMSYWARSRILEQSEAKDRERYVVKFIKIMKHLRKINNFNSYLALLSALDSAPIRRLEWQKHITEGLKEYCALIDSSSSFRAYRQALAETQPPCIPYIGLVLQDLTFVHIGNSDLMQDGAINFSKRWQQFNIVENMKRFKKGTYTFKKHERIIAFFNGFDDYLCEESMWQISESIKPRGGKKAT